MQLELELPTCESELMTSVLPDYVTFEYSARMKQSWHVKKRGEQYLIRVPAVLKVNNNRLKLLIIEWAELAYSRKTLNAKLRKKEIEQEAFLEIEHIYMSSSQTVPPSKVKKDFIHFKTKGSHHDLKKLFDEVNDEFFTGTISAEIKWSSRIGGTSFHSKRIAPSGKKFNLISISLGYDNSNCPDYAIKGVIYHEMLHIAIPPILRGGKRIVHSPEFKKVEREYPFYKDWVYWHATQLRKNLSTLKRKKTLKRLKDTILGR